jgi:hypothetical protein
MQAYAPLKIAMKFILQNCIFAKEVTMCNSTKKNAAIDQPEW